MADRVTQVRQYDLTVPTTATPAAPSTFQTPLDQATDLVWLEIEIPPGARGQVGFFLASSNQQVFPFRTGTVPKWMRLDGVMPRYDLDLGISSGDWQIVAYNQGFYNHLIVVRMGSLPTPPRVQLAPIVTLIPAASLTGSLGRA